MGAKILSDIEELIEDEERYREARDFEAAENAAAMLRAAQDDLDQLNKNEKAREDFTDSKDNNQTKK